MIRRRDGVPVVPEGTLLSGRYRIQRTLGQGGMGTVYAALDESLDRSVALKLLPEPSKADPVLVARFEREAKATASIRHPGIVEIYDRGTEEDCVYVVMERLEGQDLGQRILDGAPLPLPEALRIAADAAEALAQAHRSEVVHRDIKPPNIFLAKLGGHDVVKLLDFGLAKLLSANMTLTRTGQALGTLAYMSPEQVRASRKVGPPTDVFAMGAVLFEMLAAWPPFLCSLADRLSETQKPSLATRRPDLPQGVLELVARCLDDAPEARPTAGALASELRALMAA